jgi:hypothetical protein
MHAVVLHMFIGWVYMLEGRLHSFAHCTTQFRVSCMHLLPAGIRYRSAGTVLLLSWWFESQPHVWRSPKFD